MKPAAIFLLFVAVLAFGAMVDAAYGQQHDHMGTHDDVHEHTKDWHRPSDGMSCCHDNDCRPTIAERDMDGTWRAVIGLDEQGRKVWRPIPEISLMPTHIPPNDGRTIVCERYGNIYCFRPAEGKI